VDPDNDFAPSYTLIPDRRTVIADLKKAAKSSGTVYLASDPDREGEAIAWHLAQVLDVPNIRRIEFNEITQRAVQESLAHAHDVNMDRVNAQQARRVLDRLVGYKISPLLWKKVQKNLSAGRVQSVAVRLVVERERLIQGFVTEEYWSLGARLTPDGVDVPFEAKLTQIAGKKAELSGRDAVDEVLTRLGHTLVAREDGKWETSPLEGGANPEWKVADVRRREQRRNPAPPFITSTLQQEAARKLGFNARRTMQTAQQLYEGVELGADGHVGLITYMRTDSVAVSQEAQTEARAFIAHTYGEDFRPAAPREYKARKGAQEAHEAIRPTSVYRVPEDVRPHLTNDQYRLYLLIWQRFLASQMSAAVFDVTSVDITVADLLFRATGRIMKFEGFMVLYSEGRDDRSAEEQEEDAEEGRRLPQLSPGQLLRLLGLLPGQHFTEPAPRYTEATLVRALEERGIGRPSTYAQILSTIIDRNYVELTEKRFKPTELGCVVNDQLVRHFPDVLNADFTARIEQQLDDISEGSRDWVGVLREFYQPFEQDLARAETDMVRVKPEAQETDVPCPLCGKPMVLRASRYGKFLGCSGFPECRGTVQLEQVAGDSNVATLAARDYRAELVALAGEATAERAAAVYSSAPSPVVEQHARLGVLGAQMFAVAKTPVVAGEENGFVAEGENGAAPAAEPEEVGPCVNCGKPMQQRRGRFGVFWGCSGYPECKTIIDTKKQAQEAPDPDFSMPCPRPGCDGTVTAKRSWRGTVFYGCSNYNATPKCEYVAWARPQPDQLCPECGYPMAEKVFRGKSQGMKCTNAICPTNGGEAAAKAKKKPAARAKAKAPAAASTRAKARGKA
jgi:DNA topoisomerase-1